MKLVWFVPMLFVMMMTLAACDSQQGPQLKIGVVDGERLMRDSVPGQEAMKFIEAQQNAVQSDLAALEEKVQNNPEDAEAKKEFQKAYSASIQKLQAEAQNAVNLVQDAIKRSLNSFREKNGYDMLVYSEIMAAYSPAADVTTAVLAEVDKQKVEFKPVVLPQPVAPAGADAVPGMGMQIQPQQANPVQPGPDTAMPAAPK